MVQLGFREIRFQSLQIGQFPPYRQEDVMGPVASICTTKGVSGVPTLLSSFGTTLDFDKFKAARSSGLQKDLLDAIYGIAVNLDKGDPKTPPTGDVCFISCSTASATDCGPLNDSATVANYLRRIGFSVYFCLNPKCDRFLELVQYFISANTTVTVIYHNGIAATLPAGPNPDDGKDEVITLADGNISDDRLAATLSKSAKPENNTVIIISESCHTGYSWNLRGTTFNGYKLPKGVLSIASRRNGTKEADLTSEGRDDCGIFTFYLFRLLNDFQGITMKELKAKMNRYLSKYFQFLMETATSDELLDAPVLKAWVGQNH
jgi:hypothetical protein